ncbi:DUF4279 domain-containing protein [Stenotrophomonas sp. ISL-67]|nr:DUF4279 domain-containing protein [Stenotrophomonas sp. ISL-67]
MLGLSPKISYSAGDKRVTPKGTELTGFRTETFWSHEWLVGDSFEVAVAGISAKLLEKAEFLRHLKETGGRLEYFIGWFSTENSGFVLEHRLLKLISDLKINLAFDIYAER